MSELWCFCSAVDLYGFQTYRVTLTSFVPFDEQHLLLPQVLKSFCYRRILCESIVGLHCSQRRSGEMRKLRHPRDRAPHLFRHYFYCNLSRVTDESDGRSHNHHHRSYKKESRKTKMLSNFKRATKRKKTYKYDFPTTSSPRHFPSLPTRPQHFKKWMNFTNSTHI